MKSQFSIRQAFSSKFNFFSFSILLAFFSLIAVPSVEASGWGKTEDVSTYEETTWNGVYFDMNGLYLTASIPNYSGASLQNGLVSIGGEVGEEIAYIITTSFNQGFTPPKSLKEFVKMVQEANPERQVTAVKSKKMGAKYIVDIVPIQSEDKTFWRFLVTEDRLIKMGTDDINDARRTKFFDSIRIK